jgi:LAGLIDADG endonuclease
LILDQIGKEFFNNAHKWGKSKNTEHLRITNLKIITENIIPLFKTYSLQSRKIYDYIIWLEIIKIIKNKEHLTLQGVKTIKDLQNLQNYYRTKIPIKLKLKFYFYSLLY